jgi:pyruvate dehydrogenase E2 component (dihydrolipoamide acetyltransferase)
MEEGTVLRWLKHDGEHVSRGDELVEIETDKAAMTYESDSEGTLQTVAHEGATLAVGELIARIGDSDADLEPAAKEPVPVEEDPLAVVEAPSSSAKQEAPEHERVKASPLARRIARDTGVDLGAVIGSGPGGRIVKADVESATQASPAPTASVPGSESAEASAPEGPSPAPVEDVASAKGETTTVELTRTQRTIARRMAESKATIPEFTLTADVDMERCVALRAELKRLSHVDAPTYNDMIVKACALALREYPRANGSYRDGRFELHERVNVGVAVAVASDNPTGGALVVPTVFDADTKALGEVARETRALAERVRAGTVTPPELGGGTFTVSNLGMYGITSFTAIINPPQAAILAVGAVQPRPVLRKKKIVARQTMSITLACDHRILYGADAAQFLGRVRELLEEPAALTL